MTTLSLPVHQPRWRRVTGVELLGPVSGSGLIQSTCLVQRQDGQVIQLSELLNLVLETAATEQSSPELARKVSSVYGKELSTEGLHHLIDSKLVPLGLIEDSSADSPPPTKLPTADPLLALRLRGTIIPARAVRRLASWLAPLYFPPLVIAALAGLVVIDVVLFATGNALAALQQVLVTPVLLLGLFALLTTGALIHELGHATACRYGGAKPGVIGFGIYIVFPAFFTNVTDSYRLGRVGRLRTDLGGLYFNVWCVIAAGLGYLFTGEGILLLVVIVMQFQMLQQLPPTIRLDGYFILADLAGVPDLFSRVGPVVRSLMPGRAPDPRVAELRPVARRIVTIWVVTVIPLLVLALGWTIWSLPIILAQAVGAIRLHAQTIASAWGQGHVAELILGALSIFLLTLPLVGLAVIIFRLSVSLVRFVLVRAGRLRQRWARKADQAERTPSMSAIELLPIHEVRAVVNGSTAELSVFGNPETLIADSYSEIRKEIMGRVTTLASGLEQDVHLVVHDHTGQWRLVAQPDGQLRDDPPAAAESPAQPPASPAVAQSSRPGDRPVATVAPPSRGSATAPPPEHSLPAEEVAPPAERAARPSFIIEERREPAADEGWRGLVARATGLQIPASVAELDRRRLEQEVSRHWPGPRKIAVVNGKGGVGKTVTTAMLAAVFARHGGTGVLAWDNNDTRGTLGWRTEKGRHDATVQDLLPATAKLLSPSAQISDLARFVHHQTRDKYDVLRSNPELLATKQRITQEDFDALHEVVTKYFRMIFFDSGNDESAPRWLRMIDVTDQLVVVTTALGEPAESGALLLEALLERDESSAELAKNAVVVVLQSERDGTVADAQRIAAGFSNIARAAITIPFDRALHGGALRFDSLESATRNAWLAASAAVAAGL